MSVEQTTQLIQLILNSVLMSVACALVLSALSLRHHDIQQQLQTQQRQAQEGLTAARGQVRRLRDRYRLSRFSVVTGYYALVFAMSSCLLLVLRALVEWNGLIPLALVGFVLAVATLLVAVGLMLLDWHLSDRALLEETQTVLSGGLAPTTRRSRRHRSQAATASGGRDRASMRRVG